MILHLGVKDIPYVYEQGTTTGEVAVKLEQNYGVMGTFYERNEAHIITLLTESLGDCMNDILNGAPMIEPGNLFKGACSEIDKDFRKFINTKQMNGMPGVPTKASLMGVSSRFKSGNRNLARSKKVRMNAVRPSFKDTGLYLKSEISWVTD
jgi:hypothetical protein